MRRRAERENYRPVRRTGRWGRAGLILAVLLLAAAALYFSGLGRTLYTSRTTEFGLRDIGELATQEAFYTNINTISNPNRTIVGISIPFTSSKALCSYSGTIKAGLDFAEIVTETDPIRKRIRLKMPGVRVLSNEIDLDSLKIYDESNSIFNQIRIENMNQSLIVMKDEAKKQALEGGLLGAARTHAELLIRTILNSIPELEGYTCEFVWPEEDGTV